MATWMNMKGIMISEITREKNQIAYDLIYIVEPKRNKQKEQNKTKKLTILIHAESKAGGCQGDQGGDGCEIGEGTKTYKVPNI